jgi:hypothetical protein
MHSWRTDHASQISNQPSPTYRMEATQSCRCNCANPKTSQRLPYTHEKFDCFDDDCDNHCCQNGTRGLGYAFLLLSCVGCLSVYAFNSTDMLKRPNEWLGTWGWQVALTYEVLHLVFSHLVRRLGIDRAPDQALLGSLLLFWVVLLSYIAIANAQFAAHN